MTPLRNIVVHIFLIHLAYGYNCTTDSCQNKTIITNCLEPYCSCTNNDILLCSNFSQFTELNFTQLSKNIFKYIELRPKLPLHLDESLQLDGVNLHGRLNLYNLKSINCSYNPFEKLQYVLFNLAIFDSVFHLSSECGPENHQVFSNLRLFEFRLANVSFERPICPFIFQNSSIQQFIITDPNGVFQLETKSLNKTLNTSISEVEFKFDLKGDQWLDPYSTLNTAFFKDTSRVSLNSIEYLLNIEQNTFKMLPNVKNLVLENVGLKSLLKRNNAWLGNLNYHQPPIFWENTYPIDLREIERQIFKLIIWYDEADDWEFTDDKDICLFMNFPHNKLVFPFLVPSSTKFKCTCTIYWLYKNLAKYQLVFNLNERIMPVHCFSDPNWYTHGCDFEKLFNRHCSPSMGFNRSTTPVIQLTSFSSSTPAFNITADSFNETDPITIIEPSSSSKSQVNIIDSTNYGLISFIFAMILSVVAAFMLALIGLLYYRIFMNETEDDSLVENDIIAISEYI